MVRKGRDILPGHFTTLQIGLGFRERLELPYGKCENGLKKYSYKGEYKAGNSIEHFYLSGFHMG